MSVAPNPIDNPTSEEIATDTPPSVGSLTEVKAEEMPTPTPPKAEIKDISAEVNAEVKKVIAIEKKKEVEDARHETNYDEINEFEIEEDEYSSNNHFKFIAGLFLLAVGTGYFVMKNKPIKEQDIQELFNEGTHKEEQINEVTGMFN